MNDQYIVSCVEKVSSMIKSINHRKQAYEKSRANDLNSLNLDLEKITQLINDFKLNKRVELKDFKSIKIESIPSQVTLEYLEQIQQYLSNTKSNLEKFYADSIELLEETKVKYKEELEKKGLGIFHNVAETMINIFQL